MLKKILALPLLLGALATPTLAANPPTTKPAAVPLSSQQLNVYFTMGAVNVCSLNKQGVPVKKAMQGSVDQIAMIFYNIHGGEVDGQKVPQQNLVNVIIPEVLYKTKALCLGELPKADQDQLNATLAQFEAAVKAAQTKK